jgi:hypothetical protein
LFCPPTSQNNKTLGFWPQPRLRKQPQYFDQVNRCKPGCAMRPKRKVCRLMKARGFLEVTSTTTRYSGEGSVCWSSSHHQTTTSQIHNDPSYGSL